MVSAQAQHFLKRKMLARCRASQIRVHSLVAGGVAAIVPERRRLDYDMARMGTGGRGSLLKMENSGLLRSVNATVGMMLSRRWMMSGVISIVDRMIFGHWDH